MLAVAPLVSVGRISYSLYLWHWPVLAFLRYGLDRELPPAVTAAALIMSFVLAALSWQWIEQPFRRLTTARRETGLGAFRVAVVGATACCAVIGTAAAILVSGGWPSRFSPSLIAFANTATYNPRFRLPNRTAADGPWRFPVLGQGGPAGGNCFLLWGDSHGVAVSGLIDETARQLGISGAAALRPARLPLPGVWDPNYYDPDEPNGRKAATAWNDAVLRWIHDHKPRHVILCGRWHTPNRLLAPIDASMQQAISNADLIRFGVEQVREECSRAGATLWLLRQVPQQHQWRRRVIAAHLFRRPIDLRGVDRARHNHDHALVDAVFATLAREGLRVVDLASPFFCDDGWSRVGLEDESWYYDRTHVSPTGARRVLGEVIRNILEEVQRDCATDP